MSNFHKVYDFNGEVKFQIPIKSVPTGAGYGPVTIFKKDPETGDLKAVSLIDPDTREVIESYDNE